MFEVIFLGTSASSPSAYRGLSAHLVLHRQYRFLIDCGEGTQRQILKSGVGFKKLERILLTHAHLDHILGLGGLISTLARWEELDTIEIYGGQSTLRRVRDLLFRVVLIGPRPNTDIKLIPVEDGDTLLEDSKFKLTAFAVEHRGPGCFGYVFEEKARRPFLDKEAKALGVPFGPERGRLVQGETIMLADGAQITPDMVLGEEIAGTKYVHIGDLGATDGLEKYCSDATAMTVEATYLAEDTEMARRFGHMTAADSAEFAQRTNTNTLILTHISRRNSGRDIRKEAQAIFPNTYVARDFDHYLITQDKVQRTNLLDKRG